MSLQKAAGQVIKSNRSKNPSIGLGLSSGTNKYAPKGGVPIDRPIRGRGPQPPGKSVGNLVREPFNPPAFSEIFGNNSGDQIPPQEGASGFRSGGGGGGGMANAALSAFEQQKADSKKEITSIKMDNTKAYDEAVKKLTDHYATAAKDRGSSFVDAFGEVKDNLKNLGINFNNTDLGKKWDADQRRLTEVADTSLATDMAWFEKMKSQDSVLYNAMLTELAQAQMPVMSGGGGGGRRSGGRSSGGSSSGSGDTNVAESGIFYNPAVAQDINNQPDFINMYYDQAGHNPTNAARDAANDIQNLILPRPNIPKTGFARVNNYLQNAAGRSVDRANASRTSNARSALNYFNQYSPGRSPQVQKITTSTKGYR